LWISCGQLVDNYPQNRFSTDSLTRYQQAKRRPEWARHPGVGMNSRLSNRHANPRPRKRRASSDPALAWNRASASAMPIRGHASAVPSRTRRWHGIAATQAACQRDTASGVPAQAACQTGDTRHGTCARTAPARKTNGRETHSPPLFLASIHAFYVVEARKKRLKIF